MSPRTFTILHKLCLFGVCLVLVWLLFGPRSVFVWCLFDLVWSCLVLVLVFGLCSVFGPFLVLVWHGSRRRRPSGGRRRTRRSSVLPGDLLPEGKELRHPVKEDLRHHLLEEEDLLSEETKTSPSSGRCRPSFA